MVLFSILTPDASSGTTTTEDASSSLMSIPTVIQLHTGSPVVWDKSSKFPDYAALSYQAMEISPPGSEGEGPVVEASTSAARPNLGVWNCKVAKASSKTSDELPLVDHMLKIPGKSSSSSSSTATICVTVDLTDLTTVEPTISLMHDALVRFLIAKQELQQGNGSDEATKAASAAAATATTTLFHLKSTQFGLAPNDDESAKKMMSNTPEEGDRDVSVALMICAIMPAAMGTSTEDEYKEKQSHALVYYHLRRYAAALNACLCFVKDKSSKKDTAETNPEQEEQTEDEPNQQATISLEQLSYNWQLFAQGKEIWKQADDSTSAAEESAPEVSKTEEGSASVGEEAKTDAIEETTIYGPGKHHEDLIESVLIRNANYPNNWDASKDSLWKALPDNSNEDDSAANDTTKETGDQPWLGQLRDSIATNELPTKTPPPKKAAKGESKTPNDAAVSSFFENLLKDGK